MLTVDFDRWGVSRGELVLDVGCGRGRHSFEALARGLDVVAVDLDELALKQTASDAAELRATGVIGAGPMGGCARADGRWLPFADESADRVIVSEVLEHIGDDAAVMREVFRVLRPGGRAVVTVPRWWPERVCWALSDDYHEVESGHVRVYTGHGLRTKLRAAGFEIVDSHHAHALHTPYWWLKCALGVGEDAARPVVLFRRFLEWDLMRKPAPVRRLEALLNPLLGKSAVVYVSKPKLTP